MSLSTRARALICVVTLISNSAIAASEQDSMNPGSDGEIDRMEQAGRYQDLRDYIQQRIAKGADADATALSYLCLSYGRLKQYEPLFDCMAKLDGRIRQGDTAIRPLNTLRYNAAGDARPLLGSLRADAMLEFGNYREAIAEGERALAAVPKSSFSYSPPFPAVKLKLALLPTLVIAAMQAGDLEQAKRFLAQLESVEMPFGGSGMWETLKSNGLGRAYMALGQYDKAIAELSAYRRSTLTGGLADLVRGWGAKGDSFNTIYELPRRLMLGKALLETGKVDDAKAALDDVLTSSRAKDMGDLYWLTLFERGRVAARQSDLPAAVRYWRQATDVIEQQRSTINSEASKIGFVGDKQAVYQQLIGSLVKQGLAADAFEYVERSKSRALVDMLASKKDFATQGGDPEKTKRTLAFLDSADKAARGQNQDAHSDRGESSAARNLVAARAQLLATAPELATLVTVSAVPPDELKGLVGLDEALVEYYGQDNEFFAFVLDRQKLQVVKLGVEHLEQQVRDFRAAIQRADGDAWRALAKALYARLWQPVAGHITVGKIILVPHGALHYVPFSALLGPDGSFLTDRYAMRFLPSASVMKFLRPATSRVQAPLLALGDPDLGDPRYDLRFAEEEARTVANLYPGSRVLIRKDASKSNFEKAGGAFTRIHFATHGKFDADQPLSSGLQLAGSVGGDSMLTVGELYSMNLNADLVTLSACETGLGKIANGDDVVGLTRGFLYAGARSIVASLWSVDDKATAVLMESFYRNLATMNKEKALRQAQITTRNSFPQPFFWAAFQLTGIGD